MSHKPCHEDQRPDGKDEELRNRCQPPGSRGVCKPSEVLTMMSDIESIPMLPPNLRKQCDAALAASKGEAPDWEKIAETYRAVLQVVPDDFVVQHAYATALDSGGRSSEAASILRSVVEVHPAYLPARASLLQVLVSNRLMAEADALIAEFRMPSQMRPEFHIAWLMAVGLYWVAKGDLDAARHCMKTASEVVERHRGVGATSSSLPESGRSERVVTKLPKRGRMKKVKRKGR